MITSDIIKYVSEGKLDAELARLYGEGAVLGARERYVRAAKEFEKIYGEREASLFSVPGRSEISGNHTDHNHGKVIAASIDLDIIAVAAKTDDRVIRIKSEGFDEDVVDIDEYREPAADKFFSSASILAGMSRAFSDAGLGCGGYVAYTTSNVFKGSGLSSSAAFEVMVGNILNYFYCDGKVSNVDIAKMAQYAENVFFGKPCGLMDQTACAVGGFVTIDFEDPSDPVINKPDFSLSDAGYALCIVNTGGNHADLNEDYASVPAEMKAVAARLGASVLRDVPVSRLIENVHALRSTVGDRAIMRAFHFYAENERVEKQARALAEHDLDAFLDGVIASGNSSFKYLQNVYTVKNVKEQGLSLALCLTERALSGKKAAWRVHGGGFAGTIQAFVPASEVESYRRTMDGVFGAGACHVLSVRPDGAIRTLE